jgi:hypothetical protein
MNEQIGSLLRPCGAKHAVFQNAALKPAAAACPSRRVPEPPYQSINDEHTRPIVNTSPIKNHQSPTIQRSQIQNPKLA